MQGARVEAAQPGQRVALNLRDVELAELKRGMTLAAPDALALSEWLTIAIRAVDGAPPLKNGMRLRALLGTDEVDVRLRLLDHDVLEAGQAGFAQLHCETAVALPAREHVVLRLASPAQTVAGGRVLEPETRRKRRNYAPILQRLEALRDLPPEQMIAAEVAREGLAGASLRRLSQLSALSPARVTELLKTQPVLVTRSGWALARELLEKLVVRIPPLLVRHPGGLSHDELLFALPGAGAPALDEALGRLLASGVVVRRGGQLMIPRPAEDRARADREAALAARIAETLRQGGLSPPDPREIVTDVTAKRAVDRLLRDGVVVRAQDRAKGKEILFHRDAIAEAQRRLAPLLEQGPGVLVSEVGAALGISRKYTVPLLDHLDAICFTRRIGDRRLRGGASAPP